MQSIGERLVEARKSKGITIREAAEATKIGSDYLNSFENNNFKLNIPDIYARGFLRSYSSYLKLNVDKIITDYNAQLLGEEKSHRRENRESFGRLELQPQQSSADEPKHAGAIRDENASNRAESGESISIWEKLNIEKDVAIKIGIAATLALAILIAIVWGTLAFLGSEEPSSDTSLTATPANAPIASGTAFTLIANDDVRVGIRQVDGDIPLFEGVLPQGVEKELTASGSIRISYSDANALSIRIGSEIYAMDQERTSVKVTPSKILKGQQQQSGN